MVEARGRVLVVAASDSGGGAGVQGDVKTVMALGGYAMTALTAVTVQNSLGVSRIAALPLSIVRAQLAAILGDFGADVAKTGMLWSAGIVEAVAKALAGEANLPLVVDPVIAAKDGRRLLSRRGVDALLRLLVPRAALITPNAPEAAILTGRRVQTPDEACAAGRALLDRGAKAVLVKGGHLAGDYVIDVLVTAGGEHRFQSRRIAGLHTHGTGCALATASAVGLAQGLSLDDAVARARRYVEEAIRTAPGFGHGAGPIDHAWPLRGRL